MLLNTLKQIGMEEKQAKIYLACLELGEASIKDIAKKAGLKRTTIYDFLDEMLNEGYIRQTISGKKKRFIAVEPEELKVILKKKQALLEQILPQLNLVNNVTKVKPKIWFYNGVEGLKKVYADTLNYKGEILALGGEAIVNEVSLEWILDYVKKRVKKRITVRAIVARTPLLEKNFLIEDKKQLRVSKIIDPKKFPFPIEINIYGNNRVFFASANEEMGLIIEGEGIHRAMRSFFELAWENLK